ncbi:AI-2E family transporter [Candidatus Peribacteria bacterium]|nr:AI-2E family transporter [Candidatus Peribacteria bacterium]MBT4240569.1 AI-2E family transporter [Candidatus Peribacteria bacterium]
MLASKPYTFDRVMRLCVYLLILVAIVWLTAYLSDVLIPFGIAFLLAYLLNPIVNIVQRKISNRILAVSCSLISITIILCLSCWLIGNMIVEQMQEAGSLLATLISEEEIATRSQGLFTPDIWNQIQIYISQQNFLELLQHPDAMHIAQASFKKVMPGIWNALSGATGLLIGILGLFVILLYLVFILLDFERVKKELHDLIPSQAQENIIGFLSDLNEAMGKYFRAQAYLSLLVGILFAIGFTIIGLPLAIPLGLFIGLLNMVPYLPIIGIVPAGFLAAIKMLETGNSIWMTFGLVALVFIIVQILQDTLLTPRIMGKLTGLSPALLMLSLSIWGKLLGFLGLIIAIPLTCLFLTIYKRNILNKS